MRLDLYLYEKSLAKSRSYAKDLIVSGLVKVDGETVTKPSFDVGDSSVELTGELYPFVGRGGVKLDHALDSFSVDPSGKVCVDVGASTGGFTDCLLRRGAAKVYAVDSGKGQLVKKLADDPRVINLESFNAKELSRSVIKEECEVAVCDVSFISQTLLIPNILSLLSQDGYFVTLIKPQFECGRSALGKGGIVKDPKQYYSAVRKVTEAAEREGFFCCGLVRSPVTGKDGNVEFLACFSKKASQTDEKRIKEVVLCRKE
ncbi:MAG: TlyA family RNA methyltransferase [Clostridia bacterium]|nr:TlyA family RNA methyltransferase [Clostridia bacterium]